MGPGIHIGKYRLLRRLGSGGMGDVWEATDERLARTVAIKCVSEAGSGDPERLARLVQEARNLAQLEHEGIVKIYDCLDEPGRVYLVMQFVSGHTLSEIVRDRGPLPDIQCLEYLRQTAAALAVAHRRGIFHRDLKPSNIMVGRLGEAYLIDFGLALSSTQSRITQTGRAVGTLPFMAPEQLHGQECDARTDVYSLALTIFNLLTGCVPARCPDGSHAYASPPGVLPALDRVLRRCLAADPAQRYPSAEELLNDVRALTQTAPGPLIAPLSTTSDRRRRVAAWTLGCAVLALVLAVVLPRLRDRLGEQETVLIPAGGFIAGMDLADVPEALRRHAGVESLTQGGRRQVSLEAFEIDQHEVSNAEYSRFVKATGRSPPSHWLGGSPPPGLADHPVVNVTREDAEAYARWAGKRLPTAEEWEKAARGVDARVYPWGNAFRADYCNTAESNLGGTCAADAFAQDASPYGVIGMGGNVSEWTSSVLTDDAGETTRVICGGSWLESGRIVALAAFRRKSTAAAYPNVGIR
ncbi:MAG: hypothetical protein EHM71_16275, partial [Zetaproteobacteria bacterium]